MTPKVLIDCSNLHSGGAVQVASSTIEEIARMTSHDHHLQRFPWLDQISIHASTTVINSLSLPLESYSNLLQLNSGPRKLSRWLQRPPGGPYDLCFILFGPYYGRKPADKTVLGYADVTSVYRHPTPPPISSPNRYRQELRGLISRTLLHTHDRIVVESQAMADRVTSISGVLTSDVFVVPNAYHAIFDDPTLWAPELNFDMPSPRPKTIFGYVTRAYPHKNIRFLGEFLDELNRAGETAVCLLTLNESEWGSLDSLTREYCVNLGPLTMAQVPRFYEACTAAVFPSLLEAFSVTPLEAMRMGLPIFASDRDFVRTVCGDLPYYIDPLNPRESARTALRALSSQEIDGRAIIGQRTVANMLGPKDRAIAYIEILDGLLSG